MLSAGRGLQLGQTHGGTHTIPWTSTFISGKEGWFLLISLFISLPQGTAWPYGKRLAKTVTFTALLSLPLPVSMFGTASWFMFFVLKKPASALSPSPLPFYPLRAQRRSASLVKEDPQRDSDVKIQLYTGSKEKQH